MQQDGTAWRAINLYARRMGSLNEELKRLRLQAAPSISVRAMAEELGLTSSAYHFYESKNGFKQSFLPIAIARRIASILELRGVDRGEVMALAGIDDDRAAPSLSSSQERWLAIFDRLNATQRKLLTQLAEEMLAPGPTDPSNPSPGSTVHSPSRSYSAKDQHV